MREVFKNIRRELQKRERYRTETNGIVREGAMYVADGYELADIEVVVDVAQIARTWGAKAMANKSGRSKCLDGAVLVTVLRREKHQ